MYPDGSQIHRIETSRSFFIFLKMFWDKSSFCNKEYLVRFYMAKIFHITIFFISNLLTYVSNMYKWLIYT